MEPCIMSRGGCVRTNQIIICWGKTQNLQWSQTYVVTFTHNTCTLTGTHTDTLETRVWADNEEDLTSRWDVMFISLPLPTTIPPDHNSLCPDKAREGERKTERPSEENGEVKKEGATHRPHNGCGISYIANTHTGRETWFWLWCVWSPFGCGNQWWTITKDMFLKKSMNFWHSSALHSSLLFFLNVFISNM